MIYLIYSILFQDMDVKKLDYFNSSANKQAFAPDVRKPYFSQMWLIT